MHRIVEHDGSYRQSQFMRIVASLSYLLFTASGILLVLSAKLALIYGTTAEVMAWFMAVGGVACSWGSISRRWVGEFVGLPLLGTAMMVLGLLIWMTSAAHAPFIALGNAFLLFAVAGIMLTRWRLVLAIYRAARHTAGRGNG